MPPQPPLCWGRVGTGPFLTPSLCLGLFFANPARVQQGRGRHGCATGRGATVLGTASRVRAPFWGGTGSPSSRACGRRGVKLRGAGGEREPGGGFGLRASVGRLLGASPGGVPTAASRLRAVPTRSGAGSRCRCLLPGAGPFLGEEEVRSPAGPAPCPGPAAAHPVPSGRRRPGAVPVPGGWWWRPYSGGAGLGGRGWELGGVCPGPGAPPGMRWP